ncbi:hypothetical protein [Pontibacter sp. G13]|uniref:hypothetical protein n=1 Tax=Pontibacter sp. G13 TaxID=3074898 RepID=UPI00288A6DEE|nr:hypothetical protein [Pontibacter sp. G13]WNJ17788.1 hypothetical protein RJD25_23295 [Pontibacter sp. G13]
MMKTRTYLFLITALLTSLGWSCGNRGETPSFSEVPEISLASVAPLQVTALRDSIVFSVEYTDGDGDLGDADPDVENVFVKDLRINTLHGFRLQQLAPEGAEIPIQGVFTLTLPYTVITAGGGLETVRFDLYVVDRAGHQSNVVQSPEIQVSP